jgi:hypothetical protein
MFTSIPIRDMVLDMEREEQVAEVARDRSVRAVSQTRRADVSPVTAPRSRVVGSWVRHALSALAAVQVGFGHR